MAKIIWRGTVDKKYQINVYRLGPILGHLKITDVHSNQILHQDTIMLTNGALYGAEVDDIEQWQSVARNLTKEKSV